MMKRIFIGVTLLVIALSVSFLPVKTLAAVNEKDTFGLKNVESGLGGTLGGSKSLITTISDLINVVLGLLGIFAVLLVLWGGFKWMTAGGNDDQTAEARKIIIQGVVGMAIILSAWAIARFVITQLSSATGSGTVPTELQSS